MREFRKKQKKLKKIMNILIVSTAIILFVYIGISPYIVEYFGALVNTVINMISYVLIFACLAVLFVYSSKYGKSDKFLENIEYEISDNGYYFYARPEKTIEDYKSKIVELLIHYGFNIDTDVELDEFTFNARGLKKKEFFYIVCDEEIDGNDIIAYQQSAIYDVTSVNIRRKGDGVMLYICDRADESAIELSKMITPLGKKEQIKFANAIVELSTGRCYFLGNNPTKCQQMIANYVMGCDVPLEDRFICKERMPWQNKLEEHMKDFNIKDFKNGTFFAH